MSSTRSVLYCTFLFICIEIWFVCVYHTDPKICVAQDGLKLMNDPPVTASQVLGLQLCSAVPSLYCSFKTRIFQHQFVFFLEFEQSFFKNLPVSGVETVLN